MKSGDINTGGGEQVARPWSDASLPLADRVEALLAEMTLDEKVAQLGSIWLDADSPGDGVAPIQDVFHTGGAFEESTTHGLGHLTRVFGTIPLEPAEGTRKLQGLQSDLMSRTRLGIPAIAHEECLTGFAALRATQYPTPLALAASFDPETVERMATAISRDMWNVGVHQALSPVLDVVRDYRWGRVEETMGEDPYLVGSIGSAYIRGLESTGIVATLKHFAGYSASTAGRNHAPVAIGPREFADVFLVPFEMGLREGGARSVMHSYAEVDGMPPAADPTLLTDLLREQWGFDGVVVADYFGISFLESMHRIAGSPGEAGALALRAGVDVELPATRCYSDALARLVVDGSVPLEIVDRAVRRVLRMKGQLGLLDADWSPDRGLDEASLDFDPPANRALARELAERSVVLLSNDVDVLPLKPDATVALVGPITDEARCMLGCYSFTNHVLPSHPEFGDGVELPSILDAFRAQWPDGSLTHARGCDVRGEDRSGIDDAVALARRADVCVAVVGDRAGLFGRGTSGEGCDAEDLSLPGVQGELLEALLTTGTPVVIVVVSGRPYALGAYASRASAIVQAFFPGEEGANALCGVLTGQVTPSAKLPVQIPDSPGAMPNIYRHPKLGGNSEGASNIDPTPLFPFGHGLSYTTFEYSALQIDAVEIPTDGEVTLSCVVANIGDRDGAEVVQLYLVDHVAQVTRPMTELIGFARVPLAAGERAEVQFRVHADRTSFVGRDFRRVVEPGRIELRVGSSSTDIRLACGVELVGDEREVGHDRVLMTPVTITPMGTDAAGRGGSHQEDEVLQG